MKFRELKKRVREEGRVTTTVVQPPYVYVRYKHGDRIAVGFAKCNPIDAWDKDRGIQIAAGRASAKIARELLT